MSTAAKSAGSAIHISARAFITTVLVIFALMMASGILTYVVPSGHYTHTVEAGVDRVVPGTFVFTERPAYPPWR